MAVPLVLKSRNKFITVLVHLLIWTLIGNLLFVYQPLSWDIAVPYQLWVKQAIVMAMLIAAYYINGYVLVPKFLLTNRVRDFLLLLILLVTIIVVINALADQWLRLPQLMDRAFHHHGPPKKGGRGNHSLDFSISMIFITAFVLGISTSITAIQKWQHDQQHKQELEQEKTSSELSFLKAQINPHFFFNTLNNIYALTVVDVEKSREAIHKLSRMMRYLLYETQQDTTLLSKEIGFIKDYIDLMQLRLTDKVTLEFNHPENLKDVQVAPMLFLPFVENAFKHGISATQKSDISIIITQSEGGLDLTVSNSIFEDQPQSMEGSSGIGLVNTRRRLDLMYPEKYTLSINAGDKYIVKLKLDI